MLGDRAVFGHIQAGRCPPPAARCGGLPQDREEARNTRSPTWRGLVKKGIPIGQNRDLFRPQLGAADGRPDVDHLAVLHHQLHLLMPPQRLDGEGGLVRETLQ